MPSRRSHPECLPPCSNARTALPSATASQPLRPRRNPAPVAAAASSPPRRGGGGVGGGAGSSGGGCTSSSRRPSPAPHAARPRCRGRPAAPSAGPLPQRRRGAAKARCRSPGAAVAKACEPGKRGMGEWGRRGRRGAWRLRGWGGGVGAISAAIPPQREACPLPPGPRAPWRSGAICESTPPPRSRRRSSTTPARVRGAPQK